MRIICAALFLGLRINSAWGSDIICMPRWTLQQREYDRCNNVPMLAPGNNSRLNLQLLMADEKMAALEVTPPDQFHAAFGYGKVPFLVLLNSMDRIRLSQPETAGTAQPEEYAALSDLLTLATPRAARPLVSMRQRLLRLLASSLSSI